MKKLFTILAVAAVMVSCAKEDVVSVNREAIGFDNAFIDNATRSVNDPSYSSAENGTMFTNFAVFGHVNGAVLFNGAEVTGSGLGNNGSWTYAGTQYWINGAKYNFSAIAPKTNGGWTNAATSVNTDYSAITTTFNFTNNATTDLLYSEAQNITGAHQGNSKVAFTFRHLLSKVKFSFTNAYNATGFSIRVKNIVINDAYSSGAATVTSSATNWTASNPTLDIAFGNAATSAVDANEAIVYNTTVESYNERFLIPGAITGGYNVTFTVDLLADGQLIDSYNHTAVVNFTPAPGTSYDIKAVIDHTNIDPDKTQEAIEFTVTEVSGWANGNTTDENGNEKPEAEIQDNTQQGTQN